ncbi:MAG: hypothetical protein JWO46_2744 [Nocardioidaceae bacterium]|nr:hypothetical protein [Nocardioidaceae bacterium]
MSALELSYSRVVPTSVENAFDVLLPVPLERIFGQRHLLIPPLVGTDQDGVWGSAGVGQSRIVKQSDGGRMREVLTSLERPREFGYDLSIVKGPLRLIAGQISGVWRFEPAGAGTKVTWAWTVQPASAVGGLLLPALRPLWNGFAAKGFDRIDTLFA